MNIERPEYESRRKELSDAITRLAEHQRTQNGNIERMLVEVRNIAEQTRQHTLRIEELVEHDTAMSKVLNGVVDKQQPLLAAHAQRAKYGFTPKEEEEVAQMLRQEYLEKKHVQTLHELQRNRLRLNLGAITAVLSVTISALTLTVVTLHHP